MLHKIESPGERQTEAAGQSGFLRYALYYTPDPGSALDQFGRAWFGEENAASSERPKETALTGFAAAPARHRLRALMLAPFALRPGIDSNALHARLKSFAACRKPEHTGPLALLPLGSVLTLRPAHRTPAVDWLAAQCLAAFDCFRVPHNMADCDRWLPEPLTDRQRLLLKSWGSPYVLGEYRFHMRLTEPLDSARLERVAQALWPLVEHICARGVSVDALSLFGDPGGGGPLQLIRRYPLGT